MKIGNRAIGLDYPPYIIAEIGVNHDGEVERALSLTDAAADAGADAVKLQFFETDRLMSRAAKLAAYQKNAGETDPIEMLRRLELTIDEMSLVVDRAHERGIHAIVTVFSTELVEIAETLAWDAYKTASPDLINYPLIHQLGATKKPLIVSTGAASALEASDAFFGHVDFYVPNVAILHCVSSYPTPIDQAGLAGMLCLPREIIDSDGAIGYSDHTQEVETGEIAVRIGASVLEKHLTYNRLAKGPDHNASLEPDMLKKYVHLARNTTQQSRDEWLDMIEGHYHRGEKCRLLDHPAIGDIDKSVSKIEQDVRLVSRQSVVSTRKIGVGETITREMLTIKRPGTGILAFELDTVVGQQASRTIEADVPIMREDLE
jgi:N,N'-diacetyllegionaminate synthase